MPSLSLYLDECAYSKRLKRMLAAAGHTVISPFDVDLVGANDLTQLSYATEHNLVVVTKDAADFVVLHKKSGVHAGILAIREEADRTKNMTYGDTVRAINNIAAAKIPLRGHFYILNHWRW